MIEENVPYYSKLAKLLQAVSIDQQEVDIQACIAYVSQLLSVSFGSIDTSSRRLIQDYLEAALEQRRETYYAYMRASILPK